MIASISARIGAKASTAGRRGSATQERNKSLAGRRGSATRVSSVTASPCHIAAYAAARAECGVAQIFRLRLTGIAIEIATGRPTEFRRRRERLQRGLP